MTCIHNQDEILWKKNILNGFQTYRNYLCVLICNWGPWALLHRILNTWCWLAVMLNSTVVTIKINAKFYAMGPRTSLIFLFYFWFTKTDSSQTNFRNLQTWTWHISFDSCFHLKLSNNFFGQGALLPSTELPL